MISAEEARALAGPSIDEQVGGHLNVISDHIRKAATAKSREVILREDPYCYWLYGQLLHGSVADKVVHELRENGYIVELFYEERQLVDIGLRIRW